MIGGMDIEPFKQCALCGKTTLSTDDGVGPFTLYGTTGQQPIDTCDKCGMILALPAKVAVVDPDPELEGMIDGMDIEPLEQCALCGKQTYASTGWSWPRPIDACDKCGKRIAVALPAKGAVDVVDPDGNPELERTIQEVQELHEIQEIPRRRDLAKQVTALAVEAGLRLAGGDNEIALPSVAQGVAVGVARSLTKASMPKGEYAGTLRSLCQFLTSYADSLERECGKSIVDPTLDWRFGGNDPERLAEQMTAPAVEAGLRLAGVPHKWPPSCDDEGEDVDDDWLAAGVFAGVARSLAKAGVPKGEYAGTLRLLTKEIWRHFDVATGESGMEAR